MLSDFWEENAPKRCDICKSREFFRKGHALATKCKLSTLVVASLHFACIALTVPQKHSRICTPQPSANPCREFPSPFRSSFIPVQASMEAGLRWMERSSLSCGMWSCTFVAFHIFTHVANLKPIQQSNESAQ